MRLALATASALLIADEPGGDELFAPIAIGAVALAAPIRDPDIRTTNATIATAPIDTAASVKRARGETPD